MALELSIDARSAFELEQACRRSGPARPPELSASPPACRRERASWGRAWTFPDAPAADAWNDDWDAWVERGGEPPRGLLGAAAPALPPLRHWMERHALAALHEELARGAPCPLATVGGRVELWLALVYEVSTLPWRRDELTLRLALEPFAAGADEEPLWTLEAERLVPLHALPEGVAEQLVRARWPLVESTYPAAAR
jgi:hypothetical protein